MATEGHIYRFCGGGYTAPNKLAHRYDIETQLSIFDMAGKQVFFEKLSSGIEGLYEMNVGELRPSMYVLHLQSDTRSFVGKIAVH